LNKQTNDDRDETLYTDLEALYDAPVPGLAMPAVAASTAAHRPIRWRPAALAAAAIAGLALFLGAASSFGGSPSEVSAETILQKTAGVAKNNVLASALTSYHMVSRHETFADGGATFDSVTEVWYGDAEHQRTETRGLGSRSDEVSGNIQSGDDIWMYATVDGKTAAVHGNIDTLGFRTGVPVEFSANSLQELLELYSGGGCSSAKLVDEEQVAGRDAYVIEVTPTWDTCPMKVVREGDSAVAVETRVKVPEAKAGESGTVEMTEGSASGAGVVNSGTVQGRKPDTAVIIGSKADMATKIWVDAETFVTLKTESYADGELVFRYEVTELETGVDIPDSVFEYDPPAGVQVVEAATPQEMKGALSALYGPMIEKDVEPAPDPTNAGATPIAPGSQ
jgi:hypothetical protein